MCRAQLVSGENDKCSLDRETGKWYGKPEWTGNEGGGGGA